MFQRTPDERAEDEARAAVIADRRLAHPDEHRPSYAPTPSDADGNPGVGSYAAAIVLPIVGVILAIRQFARNNSGPAVALLLTSVVAGFAWYVGLSSTGSNSKCVVTAMGGNKLCGDDARAWCDSTDSIRSEVRGLGDDATIDDSQATCDEIRSQ